MPLEVTIESAGVQQGLADHEAALTLKMLLDRVMILILFNLTKKGGVAVLVRQPKLKLKVDAPHQGHRGL